MSTSSCSHNNDHPIKIKTFPSQLLYLNSEYADVYFTFESSDKRVPAHKNILSAVSPVFKAELYNNPEKSEVKIEDENINEDVFKVFLQFFYLKEANLTMEYIQHVIYLAQKYQHDECKEVCSTFLIDNLTNKDLCLGYQLAMHYNLKDLEEFCQREICINAKEVFESEGFLKVDWNILKAIVKFKN